MSILSAKFHITFVTGSAHGETYGNEGLQMPVLPEKLCTSRTTDFSRAFAYWRKTIRV